MDRFVIHLNVADFAVAVERLINGKIKNRPVIVAPLGAARAHVYDMSEEAYGEGVRKGMPLRKASLLCKDAHILPPTPSRYEKAMSDLVKKASPYSPLIEPGERDGHIFIDVTGTSRMFGPPVDIAFRLSKHIRKDLGFSPIWSVASNKLISKVATRMVKPVGEYIVGPGDEAAFLEPIPISLLPGIGREDLAKLSALNFKTVSEVSKLKMDQLRILFGKRAPFIYQTIRGVDASPVLDVTQKQPEITVNHTFKGDTNHLNKILSALYFMVEEAGFALRLRQKAARHFVMTIDYADGLRAIRQRTLKRGIFNDGDLFETAKQLLLITWQRRVRMVHIRLIMDRLVFPPAQLDLFPEERCRNIKCHELMKTVDTIREKFGRHAIERGRVMTGVAHG